MTAHGRPTAAELVAAVAEFLESDVRSATDGQVNFHARVAANVLRTVARELESDGTAAAAALSGLGADDEAALAAAIRAGELDERGAEVTAALRTLVYDRLDVAHPGYAVESIADRLFAAISAGDVDAVGAMWSDDIVVFQPGTTRPRDKARALKVVTWFVGATAERHYDVLTRDVFAGGFVQQHVLRGFNRVGTPFEMRVGMVVRVGCDGLITALDEYLDPATLAPLYHQNPT